MQFIKSQSYVTFSMTPDELQALHDLIKLANKDCPTLTHIKHTQVGRFVAQIRINGRKVHLGIFETAEEAGAAYAQAANQNHKEYARLA